MENHGKCFKEGEENWVSDFAPRLARLNFQFLLLLPCSVNKCLQSIVWIGKINWAALVIVYSRQTRTVLLSPLIFNSHNSKKIIMNNVKKSET